MTYLPKKYRVESVKQYTDDVKLFRIKCDINPKPGTFLEVSLPGFGECPLASCSYDKKRIDILMRNAGNVTSMIFNVKKGDYLGIRGAYGKGFPFEELNGKDLILVAGGTGIAPITSFINYVEQNRKDFGDVYIYFGFRDEANILLNDRIERWAREFKVNIILSADSKNKNYERGFVNEVMARHRPNIKNAVALFCGPEIMMDSVTKQLKKFGLSNDKIYWSLERRMECGFGSCGRCQIQDLYTCKDGPVFRYDVIKPRLDNENSANRK